MPPPPPRVLAAAGFNLNFAPLVDLDVNPANPIIGRFARSFSADPGIVVPPRPGRDRGAPRQQGVRCCLKHFPGHGSSRQDSHLGFTDVSDTWEPLELAPFRELIARGLADSVMTAHIFNRRLDPEFPATLSQKTVTGLLRQELGFAGAVISDDMDMKAISAEYEPGNGPGTGVERRQRHHPHRQQPGLRRRRRRPDAGHASSGLLAAGPRPRSAHRRGLPARHGLKATACQRRTGI